MHGLNCKCSPTLAPPTNVITTIQHIIYHPLPLAVPHLLPTPLSMTLPARMPIPSLWDDVQHLKCCLTVVCSPHIQFPLAVQIEAIHLQSQLEIYPISKTEIDSGNVIILNEHITKYCPSGMKKNYQSNCR